MGFQFVSDNMFDNHTGLKTAWSYTTLNALISTHIKYFFAPCDNFIALALEVYNNFVKYFYHRQLMTWRIIKKETDLYLGWNVFKHVHILMQHNSYFFFASVKFFNSGQQA